MFGIKRKFQRCKVWPNRFKEFSVQMHQIWVPPSKPAVSATVVQSSKRTVADRHRLAAYHNKHCWRAFRGTNIDDLNDLEPQNRGFSDFFSDLWLPHTFQEWTASKSLEIDQENLRTKLNWCCCAWKFRQYLSWTAFFELVGVVNQCLVFTAKWHVTLPVFCHSIKTYYLEECCLIWFTNTETYLELDKI